MIKKEETYYCDICKSQIDKENYKEINYPVQFLTDQNDGTKIEPYIAQTNIGVCNKCLSKIIKVIASGCQGCNEYNIKEK